MFREWKLEPYISSEDFIEKLLTENNFEVLYYDNHIYSWPENTETSKVRESKLEYISNPEIESITKNRVKQGVFRKKLLNKYKKCCLCGLDEERLLVASHIKPWSHSNNHEKLDINNGLLLCVTHDALFDNGFISFEDNGSIIVSNNLDQTTKNLMNIKDNDSLLFNLPTESKKYLDWHKSNCFEKV
ncbi:HNH endonuclease [Natranaerofaba carboxydovora]|uniref:HNH endonuclease n=1 Tax=Natranaerofaba carboxydovora TaxID=2742683 RepID=UPI001F13EBED|nr:HNH endonuclease [Natranaerofaba carboxydovora]